MQKPDFLKMRVGGLWNLGAEVIKAVSKTRFTIENLDELARHAILGALCAQPNPLKKIIFTRA